MDHRFEITSTCKATAARTGKLHVAHGVVVTPTFMPVGTQATVKALAPDDLHSAGAQIVLGNTYHLYLRPGIEVVRDMGGLHKFMSWDRPILTDSGGFQVFSLAALRRVDDGGVLFRSHLDGSEHFLTPELATQYQETLGSDIAMVLDVCHPHDADLAATKGALARTHRWAERCLKSHQRSDQALYAIVQGGASVELRLESIKFLVSLGFPGYAVGGLSVGEPKTVTSGLLERIAGALPRAQPHYFMGLGAPDDIVRAVSYGMDMFDSVLPTRLGRHGAVYTFKGRVNLRNSAYERCDGPVDRSCDCYACRTFSMSYIHHLFRCDELLAYRLATLHNVRFMMRLMETVREAIASGGFDEYRQEFLASYRPSNEEVRLEQKRRWLNSKVECALGPNIY